MDQLLLPLGATALILFMAVLSLGKPLRWLCTLILRTSASFATLFALQWVGPWVGIALGANVWNALTLTFLGLPGFALLLMLQWYLPQLV